MLAIILLGLALVLLGIGIVTNSKTGPQCTLGMLLAIGGLFLFLISPVFAHDHNKPSLDAWYAGLRSGKGPCCGGPSVDAKTLDGAEWGRVGDHYWVIVDGVRHDVDDEAVLKQPNLDGRALVWPIGGWGGVTIRCFMPGSLT